MPIPTNHLNFDPATKPFLVGWRRRTPTGRLSKEWHIVLIKRLRRIDGRYVKTKYHDLTTEQAVELAKMLNPPRAIRAREGVWEKPLIETP